MPLSDVHWDTPFYLYKAKLLVETPVYTGYVRHADRVAREVMEGTWDRDLSYFPQAYWYFTRLGHLTALGGFVALGENGRESLLFAHWGYGILLALSVALLVILALQLAKLFSGESRHLVTGAALSALLFMASGQYWHMTGNLVAEVPALFFVGIALNSLVACQLRRSWVFAAAAGIATFLVYVTRTDFLWIVLTLGALLAVAHNMGVSVKAWHPGLIIAGFVALSFYGVYAWVYSPLADPRVFVHLWSTLRHSYQYALDSFRITFLRMLMIAGGFLWVGAVLALPVVRKRSLARFGLIWLLLLGLPWLVQAISGGWAQSRMLMSILPALFILSAVGWSRVFEEAGQERRKLRRFGPVAVVVLPLMLVTHSGSYEVLRSLPGGWHLQYVRSFLRPDQYEQRRYPVEDLARISDTLYGDDDLKVVVIGPSAAKDVEYVNLIRFFGPRHAPDWDLFEPEPQKVWRKGLAPGAGSERVVFRSYFTEQDGDSLRNGRYRLFVLVKKERLEHLEYGRWLFTTTLVVSGEEYTLAEVTRAVPRGDE
jgi:hypothetical protein